MNSRISPPNENESEMKMKMEIKAGQGCIVPSVEAAGDGFFSFPTCIIMMIFPLLSSLQFHCRHDENIIVAIDCGICCGTAKASADGEGGL